VGSNPAQGTNKGKQLKFEIRTTNWYKRRINPGHREVESFHVVNMELCDNSYCSVIMKYSDEQATRELSGRVLQNAVTGAWVINAINQFGDYLLIDVALDTDSNPVLL
jgi:hypothetical protein